MIALIQRVLEASVSIDGAVTAHIGDGLLALVGVEKHDDEASARRLAERMLRYRIFSDEAGRMNRDLIASDGGLLLVPQFTLAADTQRGRRPGFSTTAEPAQAESLFGVYVDYCRERLPDLGTGTFGAYMQVASINDGPVTFHLQVPPPGGATLVARHRADNRQ